MTPTTAPMTAEEFFDWVARPENDGGRYELDAGEVVAMPPPSELHGYICWMVAKILTGYLTARGSGYLLTNDAGMLVRRGPDSVRGPDIMLFLTAPAGLVLRSTFTERIPDLIVEVRSPTDRDSRILRRIEQFHRRGVPLVWVVDPEERTVTAYRPNEFPKLHDEADNLTGNGVLPDFRCQVGDLFALPGGPSAG